MLNINHNPWASTYDNFITWITCSFGLPADNFPLLFHLIPWRRPRSGDGRNWEDSDHHLSRMLSSRSSYLNYISIVLNIYLNLLSEPNTKVDLSPWLICVVLFSKCQSKDGIERKDSNKPHGTPRVPKEELRSASVCRRGVSWAVQDWISLMGPTYLYYFGRLRRHSSPCLFSCFPLLCYNNRWLYCTMFPPSICLLNMFTYFILLTPTCLTFLPIATYYYLTSTMCSSLCYY